MERYICGLWGVGSESNLRKKLKPELSCKDTKD